MMLITPVTKRRGFERLSSCRASRFAKKRGLPEIPAALPSEPLANGLAPAASESSTPSATGTWLLRTRFVHRQRPAAELRAVQRGNRRLRFRIGGHFHEPESTGLTRELVRDNPRRRDGPVRSEQIAQLLLGR
jgi:hypothetical protein